MNNQANKKTKKDARKNFAFNANDVSEWEKAAIKENRSLTNFIETTLNKAAKLINK